MPLVHVHPNPWGLVSVPDEAVAEGPVLESTHPVERPPYRITFVLDLYKRLGDRKIANQAIAHLLRTLTLINVAYLSAHPEVPLLYASGVRYEEEPPGQEDWQDVPTTLRLGYGDCEDLACWRAAELQVRSRVPAWPYVISRQRPRGGILYHIQVRYPCREVSADGACRPLTEDPSRRLGMK